jgi:hypothetical protein
MSSEYIPRLRRELVAAAARERRAPLPRVRPLALAAVALVAAVVVLAAIRPQLQSGPAGDGVQISIGGGAQAADVMRERLARADVHDVDVSVAGDEVTLTAPPELRATVAALAVPGRFGIYDWENSVVGRPAVGDDVEAAALPLRDAVARSRAHPGSSVVRAERDPDRAYVLTGSPAVTGADLASARAERDPQLHQPIVSFRFTQDGVARFSDLTRTVARRGVARQANQHIALVVDDHIASIPYIDYRVAPEGIDGREGGQVSGDLTPADARILAAVLSTGPLP